MLAALNSTKILQQCMIFANMKPCHPVGAVLCSVMGVRRMCRCAVQGLNGCTVL